MTIETVDEQQNVSAKTATRPESSSTDETSSTATCSSSSTSSVGNSSAPTIVQTVAFKTLSKQSIGHKMKQKKRTNNNNGREDDSEQTTSSSVIEDADQNSSSSSYKTYKNLPFGLKNHFITMPDVGRHQLTPQGAHYYHQKKPTPTGSSSGDRLKNISNKSLNNGHDDCDLSVLAPSSIEANSMSSPATPNWPQPLDDHYRPDKHLSSPIHTKQPTTPPQDINYVLGNVSGAFTRPAGDAGLDAGQCNSKAKLAKADDSCYPPKSSYTDISSKLAPLPSSHHSIHQANKQTRHYDNWNSGSLLVRFSSIMYATFLVILGCILHVSELRQKSKNSSDHIYTTVVALMGIIWLLFLQADLQRYKRYASKYILIESIFNDHQKHQHEQQQQQRHNQKHLVVDPSARSTSSSSASLVNDRMSMNTEVIFKKTAYKMYQQRAVASGHQHPKYPHHIHQHQQADDDGSSTGLIPAYKFLHGKMGANFYLKCGMAAFCFGHVIHEGLRFGQQVYFFASANVHCQDSAALVAHLVTPLYSFYQLFMMFKYSNLVINRHKILARFGLMHIIGTSVTFWFRTILEEAFEDFVHKMDYFRAQNKYQPIDLRSSSSVTTPTTTTTLILNQTVWTTFGGASGLNLTNQVASNVSGLAQSALLALMSSPISASITPQLVRHLPDSYACAQNTLLTTKSMNALPYLYPFTIEYNLLLAATFLSLYFNIGKIHPSNVCKSSGGAGGMDCRLVSDSHLFRTGQTSGKSLAGKSRSSQRSGASYVSHPADMSSDNSISAINQHQYYQRHRMKQEEGESYRHGHYSEHSRASLGEFGGEYKSNFVVNADCHSANKGLFCGFFVLLVTLVTIVIFFVTINKPDHLQLGIKINLIQEATLTTLILLITLFGFKQVVKLNRNPFLSNKVTTDDVLMLIPLPFFFIHSLLAFRAETASLYSTSLNGVNNLNDQLIIRSEASSIRPHDFQFIESVNANNKSLGNNSRLASRSQHLNGLLSGLASGQQVNQQLRQSPTNHSSSLAQSNKTQQPPSGQIDPFKLLTIALNIGVMLEVLVQTNFIIDGLRRCSESRYLRFKKPGRELITFAILLNITYWIVATFETKSVEQYKTEIEFYGPLPYMFISHTTLPVMLFYRYHSSVCLAEIWNRAYKPPKRR